MRITEKELIKALENDFPNRVIFAEQHNHGSPLLNYEIYKHAKVEGLSSVQWLISRGFLWKETGYIEPDMVFGDVPALAEDISAFQLADYILKKYPLAGEYHLSNKEDALLYQSAQETVKKVLLGDTHPSIGESTILVVETINLLKHWSPDLTDEGISGSLWNYIFLQYGFKSENSDVAAKRLYLFFRRAVKEVFERYNKFFAPEGTQRYYTSLLLHALAPKQSIEALYTILFDFYVKNLDFQYVPDDISYKAFTKGMRARWDSRVAKDDKLQLRSDFVFSGLQTLFKERPGYMAVFCDGIVRKMDAILRGEESTVLDLQTNYADIILYDWYLKKSNTERAHAQGVRRRRRTEFVATSSTSIYAKYILSSEKVCVTVPQIRLSTVVNNRPVIYIFQDDKCIYRSEMSVIGNDLCLTTQKVIIPLPETDFDFSKALLLRVMIDYDNETLYNSEKRLYRDYIVFDDADNERMVDKGTVYLFAPDEMEITVPDDAEDIYLYPHPGQLLRINLDEASTVAVGGREIFTSAATVTQFRHYASIRKVSNAHVVKQGLYVDIYPSAVDLFFIVPDGINEKALQIIIDNTQYRLSEFEEDAGKLKVASCNDGECHRIRIFDLSTGRIRHEYSYIVLSGFQFEFTEPVLFSDDNGKAYAEIRLFDKREQYPLQVEPGTDHMIIPVLGEAWQIDIEVPLVRCIFMGRDAFTAPEMVWHEDISAGEFVRLSPPDGWTSQLMLGGQAIPEVSSGCFELGNKLHALSKEQPDSELWISLQDQSGHHLKKRITSIMFRPTFIAAPIEVSDRQLFWRPAHNYIGALESQFRIEVINQNGQIFAYSASTDDIPVTDEGFLFYDEYTYNVFLKKKSIFSAGSDELIYTGSFCVGDPLAWAYRGKQIVLNDALIWDFDTDDMKTLHMRQGSGVLTRLRYQGICPVSGEETPAPCYTGRLMYVDRDGRYHLFHIGEEDGFETINPVTVWIVNEHLLIMNCATGDAVYVDKKMGLIINRSPETYMTKREQQLRLDTPDYFDYTVVRKD